MTTSQVTGLPDLRVEWELGGEFPLVANPGGAMLPWPRPARWYSLGRHALADLIEQNKKPASTLWLPDYFCEEVTDYCSGRIAVERYQDDPLRSAPNWKTLRPGGSDMVVAVNYFGTRDGAEWRRWHKANSCLLVEDHSHDPLGPWALRSPGDYAFASLRKTFPMADGALLWSPKKGRLPKRRPPSTSQATNQKLAAMVYKSAYLSGMATATIKPYYRRLQQESEELFAASEISGISQRSAQQAESGFPRKWRRQRAANVERLVRGIKQAAKFAALFEGWPRGAAPLGAVLMFAARRERDRCRDYLEHHQVYCPVHWPARKQAGARIKQIAGRILTIPSDQRYTGDDMDRVAKLLLAFR